MRVLGNILWLILGGLELAVAYALLGLVSFLFIVTIPIGVAAFRLAGFALWPFGRVLVRKPGAGEGSTIGNVVWALVAGIWLALGHLVAAVVNAVTIIGIPFAIAHVRLAGAALTPFGHTVVNADRAVPSGAEVTVRVPELG